ncbi:MAG TPA: bifunctional oligoribonuclease/PAP phosphatase NrnA [Gemmatimonadaceae bacterium]|nr:bifunctional oligoribonuclease/PAP phosphatase NrnA [Gemmatimonadaceae bacterium]
MRSHPDYLAVAPARREGIERIARVLASTKNIALSTHMNADGDGCGSEVALALLLRQMGIAAKVVNPTAWPPLFQFLLDDSGVRDETAKGSAALKSVDGLVVLDISDVKRLGNIAESVRQLKKPKAVIDHHIPSDDPPADTILADTAACATGELIYDFACVLDLEITPEIARAIYIAMLTDTGGFRFSNTSPRCHAIAGELLNAGVNPEDMYVRIYASSPPGRVQLLAEVLATLEFDLDAGLAWLSMAHGLLEKYEVRSEDLDGIVEHARSIAGTRMALFFRDLGHGKVKISFRSTGGVDVNAFARQFGGGGHAKAAGAMLPGTLDGVRDQVIAAARELLAPSNG